MFYDLSESEFGHEYIILARSVISKTRLDFVFVFIFHNDAARFGSTLSPYLAEADRVLIHHRDLGTYIAH